MRTSRIARASSSLPSPPPDADAVIRVVFESARRSGVDISSSSASSSSVGSRTSHAMMMESGSATNFGSFSSHSSTPEAAKRQARNYALRVQKFRDQQRKVAQSKTVPAATVQFSLSRQHRSLSGAKNAGQQENEEDDDDPLANLFSSIDTPRVKQMTKPLAAPIKPIPSLFDQDHPQRQQQHAKSSSSTTTTAEDLPKVVVAEHPSAFAKKGKRTPSPTRKYSSLPKVPTARTVHRSPSPGRAVESAFSDIKLDVPQLEIELRRTPKRSSSPYPTPASDGGQQQQQQTAKTVFVAPHTTTLASSSSETPSHHHQTIARKITKPAFAQQEKKEEPKMQQQQEQPTAPAAPSSTTTSSFEAVSRPTFESSSSSSTTQQQQTTQQDTAASTEQKQRILQEQARKAEEEQKRAAAAATASLREHQEDEAAAATAASLLAEAEEKLVSQKTSEDDAAKKQQDQPSSVEDWASLRAAELDQIKKEREAAALAEKEEKLAKEEKVKIDAWIDSRKQKEVIDPLTHFAGKTPAIRELHELYTAATWESAFTAFSGIHKQPTVSQETLTHALSLAAAHTWRWKEERKQQMQPMFDSVSSRLRLTSATKNLLTMLLQSDESAKDKFMKMSDEDRAQLPRFMIQRYCMDFFNENFRAGTWEANLQLVSNLKKLRNDNFMRLETILLRSISNPRNMCWQPTKRQQMLDIVQNLEHQCRTKLSQLGRPHATSLMYAYSRLHAFHETNRIFNEMKERNDLDEEIAAAYIRISNTQTIEQTIPELRKNKVNVLSSACTRAIVYSMVNRGETSSAIETIRAFATVTPAEDWSILDLRAAVSACDAYMYPRSQQERGSGAGERAQIDRREMTPLPPDAGIVDMILNGAKATWQNAEVSDAKVTNFLILALLTLGRTQDVVEISKTICNPANTRLIDFMNEQAFEAMNSTLASANLPQREVSERRKQFLIDSELRRQQRQQGAAVAAGEVGEVNIQNQQQLWTKAGQQQQATPAATTTSKASSSTATSSTPASLVPPQVSEKMLEHGRTRSWAEALALLNSLNLRQNAALFSVPASSSISATAQQQGLGNSVTLLYNCAISAAVDHPDTVDDLVSEMKVLNLKPNSTTTNTVMTSLGRSEDRWSEALDLFQGASTPKDISTYSVALSILGKRSQWEQAASVFSEMKKQPGMTKPTTVSFGLLIQAAHRDNWLLTLRAFQEMVKMHGSASAREVVVNRVVKALDGANKTVEATKLLESLRKPTSSSEGKSKDKKKNKK